MVALKPRPNETVRAMTLANCNPRPVSHSRAARQNDREKSRQDAGQHDDERPERQADKCRDEDDLHGQPAAQLVDHDRAVARGDHGQAGDRDRVAGIFRAQGVKLLVEGIDDRQKLAGVGVGNAAIDDDGVLLGGDEPPREIGRQQVDILLEGGDVRTCPPFPPATGAASPATRRCRRPPVARASNAHRR